MGPYRTVAVQLAVCGVFFSINPVLGLMGVLYWSGPNVLAPVISGVVAVFSFALAVSLWRRGRSA